MRGTSRSGGTGRRTGLKIRRSKGRGGSIPPFGIPQRAPGSSVARAGSDPALESSLPGSSARHSPWSSPAAGHPRQQACAPVEYPGTGAPDLVLVSSLPLRGPSRAVSLQINDAIRAQLKTRRFKAGSHTIGFQACDDSTAEAGGSDPGRCAENASAYADDDQGDRSDRSTRFAVRHDPHSRAEPGSGRRDPHRLADEHVPLPDTRRRRLRRLGARQVLPVRQAQLPPGGRERRLPGGRRRRVRPRPRCPAGLRAPRPRGLRGRDGDELSGRRQITRHRGRRVRGLEPRGRRATYRCSRGCDRNGPTAVFLGGLDRAERRPGSCDEVRGARTERRDVRLLASDGFAKRQTIDDGGSAAKGMYVSAAGTPPRARSGGREGRLRRPCRRLPRRTTARPEGDPRRAGRRHHARCDREVGRHAGRRPRQAVRDEGDERAPRDVRLRSER